MFVRINKLLNKKVIILLNKNTKDNRNNREFHNIKVAIRI